MLTYIYSLRSRQNGGCLDASAEHDADSFPADHVTESYHVRYGGSRKFVQRFAVEVDLCTGPKGRSATGSSAPKTEAGVGLGKAVVYVLGATSTKSSVLNRQASNIRSG